MVKNLSPMIENISITKKMPHNPNRQLDDFDCESGLSPGQSKIFTITRRLPLFKSGFSICFTNPAHGINYNNMWDRLTANRYVLAKYYPYITPREVFFGGNADESAWNLILSYYAIGVYKGNTLESTISGMGGGGGITGTITTGGQLFFRGGEKSIKINAGYVGAALYHHNPDHEYGYGCNLKDICIAKLDAVWEYFHYPETQIKQLSLF